MATLLTFGQTLLVDVVRLTIWLALLAAVFVPLERLFTLRAAPPARSRREDLAFYFINSLAPAALLAVPVSLIAVAAQRVLPDAYVAAVATLPFWAKLCLGLLVAEIGTYWAHRLAHASPLLWQFHVVHHAPEHIDWLANTRAHPLDMVFTRLVGLLPVYALGLATTGGDGESRMLPVYIALAGTVWSFFIHANVRWRFGPLEQLVSTPAFHHWHHTNDAHRDRNFAALFPWIDRLFGTLHLPKAFPTVYGVDRPPAPGLWRQLGDPVGLTPHRRRAVPDRVESA